MKMIFELNGAITSDLKDIYSPWRPAAAAASITFILRSSVAWWTKRGRTWRGLGALQHQNDRHTQIAETPYTNIVHCIEGSQGILE